VNRKVIQNSLDYIEENLKAEITAEELSRAAGFSVFHYYRIFERAVGMPVMQYILQRKLLHAIYEISQGKKQTDVALSYGFDTHAGFYKAFVREFGYTPTQFLKNYKAKKPYRINLLQEEHIMITHKKLKEILKYWGLEEEKLEDIVFEDTGNIHESACYVGSEYVVKYSANLGKVETNLTLSNAMTQTGLLAAAPVHTLEGAEYVQDGELYFYVTKRIQGKQLMAGKMYLKDYETKARYIGEVIGQLDLALEKVDVLVDDANLYDSVTDWAIPKLKGKLEVSNKVYTDYEETFKLLYPKLPKQVIHRDPNPGNIILSGEQCGFIDFELSERNVRIFDPCYAATAILSETFTGEEEKLKQWVEIAKEILIGYDSVVALSEEEKQAVPYVILSNQLISTAWFSEQEKYQELYQINKKMTEWLAEHAVELIL